MQQSLFGTDVPARKPAKMERTITRTIPLIIFPGKAALNQFVKCPLSGDTLPAGSPVEILRYGPGRYATIKTLINRTYVVKQETLSCLKDLLTVMPERIER